MMVEKWNRKKDKKKLLDEKESVSKLTKHRQMLSRASWAIFVKEPGLECSARLTISCVIDHVRTLHVSV